MARSVLCCIAVASLAGCSEPPLQPNGTACTLVAYAALTVMVQDSATGVGLGAGSTLIVRDGAFVDSLVIPESSTSLNDAPLHPMNIFERQGTYNVTVRRIGYRTWTQAGVTVTRNVCHVNPVRVTARLQPLNQSGQQ